MAFKSFRDFDRYPALRPDDFLVGYRDTEREFKIPVQEINNLLSRSAVAAPNVLYVNLSGSDLNSGESEGTAFRTIKRACAKALWLSRNLSPIDFQVENQVGAPYNSEGYGIRSKSVNIFVRAGDYIEDNPIYLPPACTIIGDNLRAVTVIPKNKFYDIIWTNNRCYVWGITFREHKKPAYSISYPVFQYLGNNTTSLDPNIDPPYRALYDSSTRIREATASTDEFFKRYKDNIPNFVFNRTSYNTTRYKGADEGINLTLDEGEPVPEGPAPVITPFKVAFLSRYFRNFGPDFDFFSETENIIQKEFWTTEWFHKNIRRPFTLTSPYTQGGSSITRSSEPGKDDAGGGILVDGDEVDGPLRSMVMDSFTQFNEGGKGIHIVNNGYAQLVSTFTICCTEGIMCESGGTCSINTSNCSFGLSGLVATGKSKRPTIIGQLRDPITRTTNQVVVYNLGAIENIEKQDPAFRNDFQPYPGQAFEIIDRSQITTDDLNVLSARNSGVYFSILSASPLFKQTPEDLFYTCVIELETNYNLSDDVSISSLQFNSGPVTSINANSDVLFYIRSTITTSAHTMEYIGTGTTLLSAIPQKGGITDVTKEVITDGIGSIFYTTTNQFGDFKIGDGLTIVQATGTIEGETFRRSILQTITPFTIALGG
jgi:hypothetical protein